MRDWHIERDWPRGVLYRESVQDWEGLERERERLRDKSKIHK